MQRSNQCNLETDVLIKYTIIFVRHGETNWSRENILKGEQDLPLNSEGCRQAENTAIFLNQLLKDAINPKIVSSVLQRASQTASIISDITGIPVSETKSELREFYDYTKVKNLMELPPNAETEEAFHGRILKVIDELFSNYEDANPLIIVSHNKVCGYLAEHFTKQKAELPFAGVVNFFKRNNDVWELKLLHLEDDIKNLPSSFMQDLFPRKEQKSDDFLEVRRFSHS